MSLIGADCEFVHFDSEVVITSSEISTSKRYSIIKKKREMCTECSEGGYTMHPVQYSDPPLVSPRLNF